MQTSPDIAIRRLTLADARALSALARDTFDETFGHLYKPEDLTAFQEESQSVEACQRLLVARGVAVWAGENAAGELVGFATAGPCKLPVPNIEKAAGEIRQLYLLAAVQREGLGTRLLVTVLDWLTAQQHSPIYVGVWSGNFGAQRLYARYGFGKIGEYDFPVGKHLDREFILKRNVNACP
ncbi:MAG: GNAT family N-acetyltransferase [Gammaproteobacteria bacterium]|nr:GNAT family N-acetyltransferase [Gammaproteobacteria bacterium]